jgi:hypothetical protein
LGVVTAWVDLHSDIQAVQQFSFDPDFDDPGN